MIQNNSVAVYHLLILLLVYCAFNVRRAAVAAQPSSSPAAAAEKSSVQIQSIIDEIQCWKQQQHDEKSTTSSSDITTPFVTLTYAQSIDGKIALLMNHDDGISETSGNYPLSDTESLRMTHALRSIHDAILIGGKTLAVDNPRLNNRLWGIPTGAAQQPTQPRPVVLDTNMKHLRQLGGGGACRATNVIACCSFQAAKEAFAEMKHNNNSEDQESSIIFPPTLEILPCSTDPETGSLDLKDVLHKLKQRYGIQSVMVEGGASILSAFYRQLDLVNCLCITVAPKLLLWNGLSAIGSTTQPTKSKSNALGCSGHNEIIDANTLASSRFLMLGSDAIFLCMLKNKEGG